MSWKDVPGSKAVIVPHLSMDNRVHSQIGLSVVELQGIDNETAVLVVEERLPKSARCITYGLILDLSKLSLEECQTLTAKGYMFFPEDRTLWTPRHLQEQWDQLDEERSASAPVPPPVQTTQTDPPAAPALAETQTDPAPPPRRAGKRKSVVGTAGDDVVQAEGKPKKSKAEEPLTLQQCVTMSASDIEKLDKTKQTEMRHLYSQAFEPLYTWGHEKLKDDIGDEVTVHYKQLHRAPPGTWIQFRLFSFLYSTS